MAYALYLLWAVHLCVLPGTLVTHYAALLQLREVVDTVNTIRGHQVERHFSLNVHTLKFGEDALG